MDEQARHWPREQGAFRAGSRWNLPRKRAVYAWLDPWAACLEVAGYKGFEVLNRSLHYLTSARIMDSFRFQVAEPYPRQ